MLNRKRLRMGWQKFYDLPEMQHPSTLRIPPAEQFFRDLYIGLASWSTSELAALVEYMGYEPDDCPLDNIEWLREELIVMFDAEDMGGNNWLVDEELVWKFLDA